MRPLKVKLYLSRPAMATRLLTLDKLIASAIFGRGRKSEKYDRNILREIFYEQNGVFASSIYFAETPVIYSFLTLSLSPKHSRRYYEFGMRGKKVPEYIMSGTGSGPLKTYFSEFPMFFTNYVYFYVNADKEKLISALKSVRYIGKKGQFGHGAVIGFDVEECKEDKSFLLNEYTPSRPLPLSWNIQTNDIVLYNINGPSWDRSGVEPCVIPPLSIGERVNAKPKDPIYTLETISATEFAAKHHPDMFMFDNKKLSIVDNEGKKACAACGIVAQKGIELKDGGKTITNITSGNFTDFRNINLQVSDFLCEHCAKALANSKNVVTRQPTLITSSEIKKKGVKYVSLITDTPSAEYIYLYHKGMQKHLLVGALPSISSSVIAINYGEHNINLISVDIMKESFKIIQEHSKFGSILSKPDGSDIWKEYSLLINPEHMRVLNYIAAKDIKKEVV